MQTTDGGFFDELEEQKAEGVINRSTRGVEHLAAKDGAGNAVATNEDVEMIICDDDDDDDDEGGGDICTQLAVFDDYSTNNETGARKRILFGEEDDEVAALEVPLLVRANATGFPSAAF